MLDSYTDCWSRVLLRCPSLSSKLAQDFVRNAFRRLAETRRWSWLVKFGQFIAPAAYSTGTCVVTQSSQVVTGYGTAWDAMLIGRQFRVGLTAPIYTIASVTSPTQLELDSVWGGPSDSDVGYSIYQCFFTVPDDFHQFICLWDPAYNWQLYPDVQQSEINMWDAQRANVGNAYVTSFRDYTTLGVGSLSAPVQVKGSGSSPSSSGIYTGPSDALFVVEITTGGTAGVAQYRWWKTTKPYTDDELHAASAAYVLTDVDGQAQELQDGVSAVFPVDVYFTQDDVFIIRVSKASNSGLPRYELWPHQQSNHVYPFLYEARAVDISDTNAALPRFIRGDVLVDMALEDVALWPGPSSDKPNPYFNPKTAAYHGARAKQSVDLLEVRDDEVWEQDLQYQYPSIGWAMVTPLWDSRFLQSHAI